METITELSGPDLSISDINTWETKEPFSVLAFTFSSVIPYYNSMAEKPSKRPRVSISVTLKKICSYKKNHPQATQEEIRTLILQDDGVEIGRTTISDILRSSEKWLHSEDSVSTKKSEGRYGQLEEALRLWFGSIHSRNLAISDEMLRVKAKKFGEVMGITGLTYSSGWLQGFKKRHGIKIRVIHGEAASVDMEVVEEGQRNLRDALHEYAPANIYNMDETGLFFRLEPNKTLATGSVSGTKKSKERITIALCSNADGTDKLQPLVIAKSARPRCFPKTFDVQSVVQYYNNSKAWMTAAIFVDWLKRLERQMAVKKRYILLLLDNVPSHIHNLQLTYVRIEMLPPNTTAHIQPMDAGIIKNFKLHYKKKLLQQYVRQVDEQGTFDRINLKQAIYFVKDAWATVAEQTIANCFSHVRILPENNPDAIISIQQNPQQEAEKELSELIVSTSIENPLTVDEYLNIRDECLTEEPMTDEDIIELVLGETPSFNDRDSDDDEEIPLTAPPYTLAEAVTNW